MNWKNAQSNVTTNQSIFDLVLKITHRKFKECFLDDMLPTFWN